MDYTNTDFWIAIFVGGSIIAAISAGQQFFWKDADTPQEFRKRAIVRDFCIGAFLTAILYMFLPESFQGLISASTSAAQTVSSSMKSSVSNALSSVQSAGGSSNLESLEIRTGPARF